MRLEITQIETVCFSRKIFGAIQKRHISQNCNGNVFLACTGHDTFIRAGSIAQDVAAAANGPTASKKCLQYARRL